jgi:hypothetical protein
VASVWLVPSRALTVAEPPRTLTGFLFHETCPVTLVGAPATSGHSGPIGRGAASGQVLNAFNIAAAEVAMDSPRRVPGWLLLCSSRSPGCGASG